MTVTIPAMGITIAITRHSAADVLAVIVMPNYSAIQQKNESCIR
jgi:hypothetical protein